jgi:hypothetical protein
MAAVALASDARPSKLRVGVFADAREQPRWIAEALAQVAASAFAEIALVVAAGAPPRRAPLLERAYGRLDQWAFGPEPCEPVDLAAVLAHGSQVTVPSWSAAAFPDLGLDVAFAVGEFDDAVLDGVARYGVWRFQADGFREVAEGEPLSASGLTVRLAAGAPARLAYQSWSRTYPVSAARNRRQLLGKTSQFAFRALREVHRSGLGWLEQCRVFKGGAESPGRGWGPILRIGGRIARRALDKALYAEQWSLAFRFGNGPGDARNVPADLAGFTRIAQPRDRDWADPFALERNGRHFVFFEELPYAAGKAHIAMIEIAPDGACSAPVRVLERDYHLSYPLLFEHEGALYMIPETAQNRSVELYRCVEFPSCWRLEKRLLSDVRCVDATLHRGADRWWLFANAAPGETRMYDDELHLFHAAHLLGDWQAHPRNPVKSDARCTRPAGELYWRNGALYRPAQICVPRYGSGICINRVLRLTAHEYAERPVARILPAGGDGTLGIHTVNRAGYLTVVDTFTRRRRI